MTDMKPVKILITGANDFIYFIVPPRNVPALAVAMFKFIQTPSLVTTMGAESRRLAEERFDVEKINRNLMDVLGVQSK